MNAFELIKMKIQGNVRILVRTADGIYEVITIVGEESVIIDNCGTDEVINIRKILEIIKVDESFPVFRLITDEQSNTKCFIKRRR